MKNFAVIGCGRFGKTVATTLYKLGYDVIAIDNDEEVIQQLSDKVTKAVSINYIDDKILEELGVGDCDAAVVGIGTDIESSVITTLSLKEIGVKYIICKAGSKIQEKILYKIGANKVITPEKEIGFKIAKTLVSHDILDKISLDSQYTIVEVVIPSAWVGKNLIELDIRKNYSINVVAIKKDDILNIVPNPHEALEKNSILLLIGKNEDFKKIEEKFNINIS